MDKAGICQRHKKKKNDIGTVIHNHCFTLDFPFDFEEVPAFDCSKMAVAVSDEGLGTVGAVSLIK